jgi:ribosomal protein S18 acetylase RimI-like enzyme
MDTLVIRRAGAADWATIAGLHAASWRSAYRGIYPDRFLDDDVVEDRRTFWREALPGMAGDRDAVFLAEASGVPVGFACLRRDFDAAGPLLDNLHVLPDRKGLGTGRKLLAAGADWLVELDPGASLLLYVWEDNRSARAFYRRLGAEEVERLEEEVPGGGTAPILRMRWPAASVLVEPTD